MFSNTHEYAIKTAVYGAVQSNQSKRVGIKDIAKKIDSTETFTEKIIKQLIKGKVINAIKVLLDGFKSLKESLEKTNIYEPTLKIEDGLAFLKC